MVRSRKAHMPRGCRNAPSGSSGTLRWAAALLYSCSTRTTGFELGVSQATSVKPDNLVTMQNGERMPWNALLPPELKKYEVWAGVRAGRLGTRAKEIAKRARDDVPTPADTDENLEEKEKFVETSLRALRESSAEAVAAKLVADAKTDIENGGKRSELVADAKTDIENEGKRSDAEIERLQARASLELPAKVAEVMTSTTTSQEKAREALGWLKMLIAGERDRREITSQAKTLAERAEQEGALAAKHLDAKHLDLEQIDNSIQTIRAETSSEFKALVDRATTNQENAQKQLQLVLASNDQTQSDTDSESTKKFREAITRNLNTARRSLDKTMEQEQSRAERLLTDIEDLIGAKRRELADMQKKAAETEEISDGTDSEAPTEVPPEGDDQPDLVEEEEVGGQGDEDPKSRATAAKNPSWSSSGVGPDQGEGRGPEQMIGSGVPLPGEDPTKPDPYHAWAMMPYKSPEKQREELRRQVQQAAATRVVEGDDEPRANGSDQPRAESGGAKIPSKEGGDVKPAESGRAKKPSKKGGDVNRAESGRAKKPSKKKGDIKQGATSSPGNKGNGSDNKVTRGWSWRARLVAGAVLAVTTALAPEQVAAAGHVQREDAQSVMRRLQPLLEDADSRPIGGTCSLRDHQAVEDFNRELMSPAAARVVDGFEFPSDDAGALDNVMGKVLGVHVWARIKQLGAPHEESADGTGTEASEPEFLDCEDVHELREAREEDNHEAESQSASADLTPGQGGNVDHGQNAEEFFDSREDNPDDDEIAGESRAFLENASSPLDEGRVDGEQQLGRGQGNKQHHRRPAHEWVLATV